MGPYPHLHPPRPSLFILPDTYSICRFPHDSDAWKRFDPRDHRFLSITRTSREISIVCRSDVAPEGHDERSAGWRCIGFDGRIELTEIGILSRLLVPLAEALISVFTISTFDTDYVLVRDATLERAKDVLVAHGYALKQL